MRKSLDCVPRKHSQSCTAEVTAPGAMALATNALKPLILPLGMHISYRHRDICYGSHRKINSSGNSSIITSRLASSGPCSPLTLHLVCLMAKPESQLVPYSKGKGNAVLPPGTALPWKRCLRENGIFGQAPDQQGRAN